MNTKTIVFNENTPPPTNYIWQKEDGNFYEFIGGEWVETDTLGVPMSKIVELENSIKDLEKKVDKDIFLMNNGESYETSALAEAAAATSEWLDPKKAIFEYNYNGTARGIGNGLIIQNIYATNGGNYESLQILYLGGSVYKRIITLIKNQDNTFSPDSVGSWSKQ